MSHICCLLVVVDLARVVPEHSGLGQLRRRLSPYEQSSPPDVAYAAESNTLRNLATSLADPVVELSPGKPWTVSNVDADKVV